MRLHLGPMLVRHIIAISTEGWRPFGLEPLDQLLATARIPAHCVDGIGPVGGEQPCAHQRCDQREEAGGIAARIADPTRLGHTLAPDQLGKAVAPARGGAVRGGSVDNARSR